MGHDPTYTYPSCPKRGQSGRATVINMQRRTVLHIYKFATLPDGRRLGFRDSYCDLDKKKTYALRLQERRKIYTLGA